MAVPVATRLGVPVRQVRGRLSATAPLTDLLLHLSCEAGDRTKARRCADALATSMVAYVTREQATNGIPLGQRLVMAQVQSAADPVTTGPTRGRTLALAALAGILAAAVVLGVAARPRR
jgi:hypothetical protein